MNGDGCEDMKIKIFPPNEERKEFFEKSVKPLLIAVEENNAVDKWMFNLKDDVEVNTSSVVFFSSHKKMIFVIGDLNETVQPPQPETYVVPDIIRIVQSRLSEEKINYMEKKIQRFENKIRLPRKEDSVPEVLEELKDGSYETLIETWSARILVYDVSDSRFCEKEVLIQGTNEMPKIEDVCQDLDIQSLSLTAKHSSFSKVSYQSVSSRWKMRKKD